MLMKQMLTESEAYLFTYMTTLKTFKTEIYEKTSNELFNVISTHINNDIIEKYSITTIVSIFFFNTEFL